MHAIFVNSEIDEARGEEAEAMLSQIAPQIKAAPGFVSGTWSRSADGSEGRSMVLFSSEEAARAAAERITNGMPEGGPVKIVGASVLEVVLHI